MVSKLACSKTETGFADGEVDAAHFNGLRGLAVDHDFSLLAVDTYNHHLRRVTLQGTVSTVAGSGQDGWADGVVTVASFKWRWGIAVDAHGNIYVTDYGNHCIRKVETADGTVSTV